MKDWVDKKGSGDNRDVGSQGATDVDEVDGDIAQAGSMDGE